MGSSGEILVGGYEYESVIIILVYAPGTSYCDTYLIPRQCTYKEVSIY